jgi:hypothetical protein
VGGDCIGISTADAAGAGVVAVSEVVRVVGIVAVVVALTFLALLFRRDLVRTYFFDPLESGRNIAGGLFVIVFVWTGLRGGFGWMFVASIVAIAFVTAYVIIEQPHKDVV